ncbi:MAG: hypothetical protein HYS34_11445, partial [Acidobacteria bacterium]|nr:hypothetical protein [Acidobacteriota bacterium]
MVCRSPLMAERRARKRQALVAATMQELARVRSMVARGTPEGQDSIGVRVGRVVNKYEVAKQFALDIRDHSFSFCLLEAKVAAAWRAGCGRTSSSACWPITWSGTCWK